MADQEKDDYIIKVGMRVYPTKVMEFGVELLEMPEGLVTGIDAEYADVNFKIPNNAEICANCGLGNYLIRDFLNNLEFWCRGGIGAGCNHRHGFSTVRKKILLSELEPASVHDKRLEYVSWEFWRDSINFWREKLREEIERGKQYGWEVPPEE